jgi:hypothetical protein
MAMDSDVLGLALAKVIMSKSVVPPTPDMVVNTQQYWKDIAKEIVDHIQNNAEVPSGITVSTGGGDGKTTGTGTVK